MSATHTLAGRRILIVEDEGIIALWIEEAVLELGCLVVGPAGTLAKALRLAREENIDAAILDVNVRSEKTYSVAEILQSRGIPFALASGYADWSLPVNLQGEKRLFKPYTISQLETCLLDLSKNI